MVPLAPSCTTRVPGVTDDVDQLLVTVRERAIAAAPAGLGEADVAAVVDATLGELRAAIADGDADALLKRYAEERYDAL